jgi:hypothetical protein
MTPFTKAHRREGKAAMEAVLTSAARARRRFKAGRPAKVTNEMLSPLDAMGRAVREFQKLQNLMQAEQGEAFEFADTKAALIYVVDEAPHAAWLPPTPDGIGEFVAYVNSLALQNPIFLGMLFRQIDREAKSPDKKDVFWVLQFWGGPLAEKHLRDARDLARIVA